MTQVNSASPVQPNNNYRKPDYKGALATAGVGSVAWGVGEYFFKKTPFIDNKSNLSDSFVRSIKEGLENLKDPKYLNLKIQLEKLNCKIDKCTSAEELNNFFKNNKKHIAGKTDDYLNSISEYIKNEPDLNKTKKWLKTIFEDNNDMKNYVKEIFESCKNEAGKLVHDANKISQEKFNLIKSTADKFRKNNALGATVSCAVISAAIMCIFEYFVGRKAKKQAQQQAQ